MSTFPEEATLATTLSSWTIDPVHSSVEFSLGYGIDAWGLPSVLSALGIVFSIAFVCLFLPLILRETARTMKEASV
jgi:hypothetical protein